jgi:hypothetical protein
MVPPVSAERQVHAHLTVREIDAVRVLRIDR